MAAPLERIEHGTIPVGPIAIRLHSSLTGFDRGDLDYKRASFGTFIKGAPIAEYPNLRIQEIEERTAADGNVDVTIEVEGLISGNSKRIGLQWREDPFNFDTAEEEWIVLSTAAFTWASALSGFSNMLLVGQVGTDENLDGRWARRTLSYRGIKKAGLTSRRVTVNENIVSPSDPIEVDLTNPLLSGTVKVQASLPRIVCIESVKSTSAPDTTAIPGAIATPISGVAFPSVRILAPAGPDLTTNWPYGWKLGSIDPEYLHAGSNINVTTYTYEYVQTTQF